MSACGDYGVFTCHVAATVIFDQLACRGARTAKRRIVSERRRREEEEHQGYSPYRDHFVSRSVLGRSPRDSNR
jgi:hypothetical protein